ncbi:hypothetical protein FEP82_05925 [Burkholderia multivorans]|nr:hypothetical protein [Burkholderia multivorans]MDR8828889.1 hypothetical protein [Burkholderia multivorans]
MNRVGYGATLCAAVVALYGCGGGDDGGSPPTASVPQALAAQGIYGGTTSAGSQISGLVLETGEYYVFYANGNILNGVLHGNLSCSGATCTSTGKDYSLVTRSITTASVSSTYTEKTSLSGSVTENGNTVNFSATYDNTYDTPISVATLAGQYSGTSAAGTGTSFVSLTVNSNGTFSGSSPGTNGVCSFSGAMSQRASGKNVMNLTVTFNGSACALGTATVAGYAVPVVSNGHIRLYTAGLLADQSDGFIAITEK